MAAGFADGVGKTRLCFLRVILGARSSSSLHDVQAGEQYLIGADVELCVVVAVTPDTLQPVTVEKQVVEHDRFVMLKRDLQKTEQSDAMVVRLHGCEVEIVESSMVVVAGLSFLVGDGRSSSSRASGGPFSE